MQSLIPYNSLVLYPEKSLGEKAMGVFSSRGSGDIFLKCDYLIFRQLSKHISWWRRQILQLSLTMNTDFLRKKEINGHTFICWYRLISFKKWGIMSQYEANVFPFRQIYSFIFHNNNSFKSRRRVVKLWHSYVTSAQNHPKWGGIWSLCPTVHLPCPLFVPPRSSSPLFQ